MGKRLLVIGVVVDCLVLSALAAVAQADERLKGIACRSVHLAYAAPEGVAFYNEVAVDRSAEGTYFCVCGFRQGYYGIQELGGGKKVVIFSVWDPGRQNDPKSVEADRRVQLVYNDPKVRVKRFGGETKNTNTPLRDSMTRPAAGGASPADLPPGPP